MDSPGQQAYWRRCIQDGVTPKPYHETEFWHPDTLPGMRGFELARDATAASVEPIVADSWRPRSRRTGTWDVVLYLGVLYHMEDPLGRAAARRSGDAASMPSSRPRRSTIPAFEHEAIWRFFPGRRAQRCISRNRRAPDLPARLGGALTAAGFAEALAVARASSAQLVAGTGGPHHYRLTVHAAK